MRGSKHPLATHKTYSRSGYLAQRKGACNVKAKIHITVEAAAAGAGQETGLKHGLGIGKMQLENMTAGIQVKPYWKGIVGVEWDRLFQALTLYIYLSLVL